MDCKYIELTYRFEQEGENVRAYCVELGTSVFAKTEKEAYKILLDAIDCHLNTLEEVGEAEHFFNENNIIVRTKDAKTILTDDKQRTVEIKTDRVLEPC